MARFRDPFYARDEAYGERARTLAELAMCALSASLRSKPEWWRKIKDGAITARWKKEAMNQGLGEKHVDYVLAELHDYAALRDAATGIEVSCFDKIWQSDSLISEDVCNALKDGVRALEDVPEDQKDWHPRSQGLVLDLVHPSLYPLVYGRTLVHDPATRKFSPAVAPEEDNSTSARFAWLPTDFSIAQDGSVTRGGYINNLHLSQGGLYTTLERIVGAFVPLFERVLSDLLRENQLKFPLRVPPTYDRIHKSQEPEEVEGEPYQEFTKRWTHWRKNEQLIVLPDPPAYVPCKTDPFADFYMKDHPFMRWMPQLKPQGNNFSLRGKTIQVIVKLANIILTPERPSYPGGSWHVEGMQNEHIVASGIFYYDEENISESRLAFRTGVAAPPYEQDDYYGVQEVWGLENEGPLVQDLGSVLTKAGRCIAFPNIYQHRVAPFRLIDPSRGGHRKILALFLVDPNVSIPSTSVVMPQQVDWVYETLVEATPDSHLQKMPVELLQMVAEVGGHTMTRNEAFKYRDELMDERTRFVKVNTKEYFEATFNMCEH